MRSANLCPALFPSHTFTTTYLANFGYVIGGRRLKSRHYGFGISDETHTIRWRFVTGGGRSIQQELEEYPTAQWL
jgi:hypothetical protein